MGCHVKASSHAVYGKGCTDERIFHCTCQSMKTNLQVEGLFFFFFILALFYFVRVASVFRVVFVLYIGLGMTVYILYMQSVYFCFYAREKGGWGQEIAF